MGNSLALNITAVDRATKVIRDLNRRVDRMTRPFQNMQRSLQQFGRAAGFGVVKEKLQGVAHAAKRVATAFGKIGAPLLAIVGGGTLAGLYALTDGWARFGLRLTQTSRILGVNTQRLYDFQNAARLLGISGETATQTFQSFADTLQDARWGRNQQAMGLLLGLGIHLKNTKSGSIDAMNALGQVADKIHQFQKEGHFGAARTLARQLGVSALLPVLMQGRKALEAYEAQSRRLTGAMNWQQAAAAAMQWNRLHIAMEGVKNTIGAALLPAITPLIRQFGTWIEDNRTLIATDLRGFIRGLGAAFRGISLKGILDEVLSVVKGLMNLTTAIAGVSRYLGGLKGILEGLAGYWVASKVLKYGFAFYKLTGYINGARKSFLAWQAARGGATTAATAGEATAAEGVAGTTFAGLLGATGVGLLGGAAVYGGAKWWEHDQLAKLKDRTAVAHGVMAKSVMRYFERQGWTKAQAAGIAANIEAESGFNPRKVGDHGEARGIGQWHPERQAAFNSWALRHRLPNLNRAGLPEQLEYYNYELRHSDAGRRLETATDPYTAGSIVSLYDERPAAGAAQAAARGALADQIAGPPPAVTPVNVSVQNTIHRDGSATTRVQTPSGVKIVHTNPAYGAV